MSKYKNKMGIEFEGFDEVISKMNTLNGNVKEITNKGLIETHKIITQKAGVAVQKNNLPAKGKYSTGQTAKALKKDANIQWNGAVGSVPVGFSISQGGLASIFMIYGTPRYMKNQKMYDTFWSKKTHDEVIEKQEDIFFSELRKLEGM